MKTGLCVRVLFLSSGEEDSSSRPLSSHSRHDNSVFAMTGSNIRGDDSVSVSCQEFLICSSFTSGVTVWDTPLAHSLSSAVLWRDGPKEGVMASRPILSLDRISGQSTGGSGIQQRMGGSVGGKSVARVVAHHKSTIVGGFSDGGVAVWVLKEGVVERNYEMATFTEDQRTKIYKKWSSRRRPGMFPM